MATMGTETRARLSWMWVFVMLNMIYADILGFMYPGNLQQIMAGHADQITITPGFLLAAAIVTEIPIAMVLLTQLLPRRAARWANVVVAVLTVVYITVGYTAAPHYYFIAGLEALGCVAIAWTAWTWREAGERLPARAALAK